MAVASMLNSTGLALDFYLHSQPYALTLEVFDCVIRLFYM